jgi:site-specific DNA-methyltransferase (adenine-specific)
MTQTLTLRLGDCIVVLEGLDPESIDAFITDPPYDLTSGTGQGGFMNQKWDGTGIAFSREFWSAVYRVIKPGGIVKAFSGTRTYHRMVTAMETAGFVLDPADSLEAWAYGSGFPKSLNISKAMAENYPDDAKRFEGYGTALKPGWEPIIVGRKAA